MATYLSETAAGRKAVPSTFDAAGGNLRFEYVFSNEVLANGDVLYLGDFPANKLAALDCMLISDDLDTGAALVMSAGILNAGKTALGAGANDTWISASNIGQTGGVARNTNAAPMLSGVQEFTTRPLGIVITTAPGTPALTGKKVILNVSVAA